MLSCKYELSLQFHFEVFKHFATLRSWQMSSKNPILLWKGGLPQREVLVMRRSSPTGPLILLGPLKHIVPNAPGAINTSPTWGCKAASNWVRESHRWPSLLSAQRKMLPGLTGAGITFLPVWISGANMWWSKYNDFILVFFMRRHFQICLSLFCTSVKSNLNATFASLGTADHPPLKKKKKVTNFFWSDLTAHLQANYNSFNREKKIIERFNHLLPETLWGN